MSEAMAVIPAEPPSTNEEDADVQKAVTNLGQSVTTLLQVLDGSSPFSKLSQESIKKLSTWKLDLESLLDGNSCSPTENNQGSGDPPDFCATLSGGDGLPLVALQAAGIKADGYWCLESVPRTWKVSRQTMLSSRVGRFLEDHPGMVT